MPSSVQVADTIDVDALNDRSDLSGGGPGADGADLCLGMSGCRTSHTDARYIENINRSVQCKIALRL